MTAGRPPRIGLFDHLSGNRGGGQLVVARMASGLSRDYDVEFIHDGTGYTVRNLGAVFGLDVSRVRERIVRNIPRSFAVPGDHGMISYVRSGLAFDRSLTAPYDLFLYSGHGLPPVCYARRGLVYQHFPMEGHPLDGLELLDRWQRRRLLDRRVRAALYQWLWSKRLRTYQKVFVNSRFTASVLERMWRLTPTVLYPPVTLDAVPKPKRNVIVTLGRFDGRDRKNVRAQVEAFRRFLAEVFDDWSLCTIGFCGSAPESAAQVESLRVLAAGLPVTILVNAERRVLVDRLSEAKLFWHTRGLGGSGAGEVEPRHQEHFGIATVEAMMAGCVPLVAEAGGQPEIVEDGVSGVLCRDMDAMVMQSVRLAKDEAKLTQMAERARERSMAFHASVFDRAIADTVRDLVGR